MSDYFEDLMKDDDFKKEYRKQYDAEIKKQFGTIPEEDREDVYNEMCNLEYKPTNRPIQDVEYNLVRARENVRKQRKASRDPATESLLDFIARDEGKTKGEVRRKYKKAIDGKTPLRLRKPGF